MYRLSLQSFLRHLGGIITTKEQIEITKKRSKLLKRIVEHQRKATQFLRVDMSEDNDYSYEPEEIFLDGDDGEIDLVKRTEPWNPFVNKDGTPRPETFNISMPSSMKQWEGSSRELQKLEIQLRCGQCNDSLKSVRFALGKKAFIFRTLIRPKGPKTGKTRPWDSLHSTDQTLRLQAQIYRSAREALETLKASRDTLKRFQILERSHLKTSTTLLNPSEPGSKHDQLPWFWYLDVAGDSQSSNHLNECEQHFIDSIILD